MKKLLLILISILFLSLATANSQQLKFRSGIFLHHSTGLCIWGPNGSNTSVPQQMQIYNNNHGYTGTNAVTMDELWWPVEGDNEWYRWHRIFEGQDPEAVIQPFYPDNRIIVIKSCFPSSNVYAYGEPSDTNDPELKTVYNYKWHWRHIVNVMKTHPANFFVIWTNAPLVPNETNPTEAYLSHCFCKWAKDTLAMGLDPVFGPFPQNVYVFDFFHKLVGPNYMMLLQYAQDPYDSHPNAAATELVAPQFVNEIFNHAIAYENVYGVENGNTYIPDFRLYQNYPNPFNSSTVIKYSVERRTFVNIKVYDLLGKEIATLVNENKTEGIYTVDWRLSNEPSGVYFCKMFTDKGSENIKMIYIK